MSSAPRSGDTARQTDARPASGLGSGRLIGWLVLGVGFGLALGFLAGLTRPRMNQQQTGPMAAPRRAADTDETATDTGDTDEGPEESSGDKETYGLTRPDPMGQR